MILKIIPIFHIIFFISHYHLSSCINVRKTWIDNQAEGNLFNSYNAECLFNFWMSLLISSIHPNFYTHIEDNEIKLCKRNKNLVEGPTDICHWKDGKHVRHKSVWISFIVFFGEGCWICWCTVSMKQVYCVFPPTSSKK